MRIFICIIMNNIIQSMIQFSKIVNIQINLEKYNKKEFIVLKHMFRNYYFNLITPESKRHGRNFSHQDIVLYALFSILFDIKAMKPKLVYDEELDLQIVEIVLTKKSIQLDMLVAQFKYYQLSQKSELVLQ